MLFYLSILRDCIENGELLVEKAEPLHGDEVARIVSFYNGKGDAASIANATIILINYLSGGRGGEAAKLSFNGGRFDNESITLVMAWNEHKNSMQKPINYCFGARHELCFFFQMACYFLTLKGAHYYILSLSFNLYFPILTWNPLPPAAFSSSGSGAFVFPSLATISSTSVANKVTKIIADVKHTLKLPANSSATSLRQGAAEVLVGHSRVTFWEAVHRMGWDAERLCKIFEYIMCPMVAISIGARALAGWREPRVKIPAPQLVFLKDLSDEEKQIVLKYVIYSYYHTLLCIFTYQHSTLLIIYYSLSLLTNIHQHLLLGFVIFSSRCKVFFSSNTKRHSAT